MGFCSPMVERYEKPLVGLIPDQGLFVSKFVSIFCLTNGLYDVKKDIPIPILINWKRGGNCWERKESPQSLAALRAFFWRSGWDSNPNKTAQNDYTATVKNYISKIVSIIFCFHP